MREVKVTPQYFVLLMTQFGISDNLVQQHIGLPNCKTFDDFVDGVMILQKEAKKVWKKRAFELHPDRGGDIEEFKRMSQVYEQIMTVNVRKKPPIRVFVSPTYHIRYTVSNYGGASTAGTTTGWF